MEEADQKKRRNTAIIKGEKQSRAETQDRGEVRARDKYERWCAAKGPCDDVLRIARKWPQCPTLNFRTNQIPTERQRPTEGTDKHWGTSKGSSSLFRQMKQKNKNQKKIKTAQPVSQTKYVHITIASSRGGEKVRTNQ